MSFASLLLWLIAVGLMVLKVYAVVDCARRPAEAFAAYGKLTKPVWLAITGAAAALQLLSWSVFGIFSIAGTVAAIVYLVDVRPAVSGTSLP